MEFEAREFLHAWQDLSPYDSADDMRAVYMKDASMIPGAEKCLINLTYVISAVLSFLQKRCGYLKSNQKLIVLKECK